MHADCKYKWWYVTVCYTFLIFLLKFSASQIPYNISYFWLSIANGSQIPKNILKPLPLTIDSEFTLALADEINDHYELYDVYNPSYRHGGELNVTYSGYWNEQEGLKNFLQQYKYLRRQNLNQMTLNVSIVVIT